MLQIIKKIASFGLSTVLTVIKPVTKTVIESLVIDHAYTFKIGKYRVDKESGSLTFKISK